MGAALLMQGALQAGSTKQDDWSLNNHVSFLADFIYMKRAELRGHTLVENSSTSALNSDALVDAFNFEPGFRAGMSYFFNEKSTLELQGIWIEEWEAGRTVSGSSSLSFPFQSSGYSYDFTQASSAHAHYGSRLWDVELNYWYNVTPRKVNYFSFASIFGLRYTELDELFNLAFTRGSDTSHYRIKTKNHLYAAQIGFNFAMNPYRKLSWEATAKVGAAINNASDNTFIGDYNDSTTLRDFSVTKCHGAFLADVALSVAYQFWAHFGVHAGYQMLYYTGVGLAPEQVNTRVAGNVDEFNVDGQALIHGLFVGINIGF